MRKLPINSYFIGVVSALVLAALFPELGAKGGPLRTEILTKLAVILIFFNQGLTLPTEDLRRGVLQWKFHLGAQLFIFALFPLGVLGMLVGLRTAGAGWLGPDLWLGYLYLGLLPTTITTAVVYTSKAGGNAAAALFSTALSNVLGIFIVPTLMILAAQQAFPGQPQGAFALGPVLLKIMGLILAPLLVGQACRPLARDWAARHKALLRNTNVGFVYFIVFSAFADSFQNGAWEGFGPGFLLGQAALCALVLAVASGLAWGLPGGLRQSRHDRIAFFFCASQKTLAAGVPMAGSIFIGEAPVLGLVLLPIMLYHPLQLILGGYLLGRWKPEAET